MNAFEPIPHEYGSKLQSLSQVVALLMECLARAADSGVEGMQGRARAALLKFISCDNAQV